MSSTDDPSTEMTVAGEVSVPPPPLPPKLQVRLPVRVKGRWRRGLRLGKELVGKGALSLHDDHIEVTGRRAGPFRTVLLWIAWSLRWSLVLAAISVVLPTTSGLAVRWGAEWLLIGPLLALVVVWPTFHMIRMISWRLFQPRVRELLPWDRVRTLWSDNYVLFVELDSPIGVLRGQLRPKGAGSVNMRKLMAGIRGGYMPAETGSTRRRGRSIWLDRLLQVAALVGIGIGSWYLRDPLTDWLVHIDENADSLVPPRMSATTWEAQRSAPCIIQGGSQTRVVNKRNQGDLSWTVSGSTDGLTLAHLRWRPGSNRVELDRAVQADSGTLPGFFPGPGFVGFSMLVAEADWPTVRAATARGTLAGLESALCGGLVLSLDVTKSTASSPDGLTVARDGADLIIRAPSGDRKTLLLPVRRRIQAGSRWFHTCEVPAHKERLVVEDIRKERQYPGFFGGPQDEARVYTLKRKDLEQASILAQSGSAMPCALLDSLVWSGVLSEPVVLGPEAGLLFGRARDLASAQPTTLMADDARKALERIVERHREVRRDIGPTNRTDAAKVTEGFLAAVNWGELLERVSFANHLPLLERTRQAMSGADPANQAGQAFLIRFAEEFLARVPSTDAGWSERIDVAEQWLTVKAGKQWKYEELTVRVPDENTAGYYQIIGRFVMADVAAAAEKALSNATFDHMSARWAQLRLGQHDIVLDVDKSSSRKAVEAWVSGEFEYVVDRGLSKLMEQVKDQDAAIKAAANASYRLNTAFVAGAGPMHISAVSRNGSRFGWVGLYQQSAIVADFDLAEGQGEAALPPRWWLATAGSYVTAAGKTSGLAVIDGRPINFLLSDKIGGLVIVSNKGVTMGDLREGLTLPGDDRSLRPLRSLGDFRVLLHWLRDHKASAFQTHLLVSPAGLAVDQKTASPTLRERRLLATGTRAGEPMLAIIDIPGSSRQSIFEAGVTAYHLLSTPESKGGPGWTVTGVANLDVGSYDILVARDPNGRVLYKGPLPLSGAHNLLSFRPR